MMEVVVPFSEGEERDDVVIDCWLFLAEWLIAPSVGKRVDKPSEVVEDKDPKPAGDEESSPVVVQEGANDEKDKHIR